MVDCIFFWVYLLFFYGRGHKVRIYKEYHSACPLPLVGIGTLPPPLSPASVPLPPRTGRGGTYSPSVEGVGKSPFRRLEKKLSTLPTLWKRPSVLDTIKAQFFFFLLGLDVVVVSHAKNIEHFEDQKGMPKPHVQKACFINKEGIRCEAKRMENEHRAGRLCTSI